ncbi:MAG: O-antigen ligase family protein [bacterium]|nr:O-antigen ligase family protein [bacterium]
MLNKKYINWIIKLGLLAVPILPLVITKSLYFPFITGRNFIFRIIIEIIFVLWVWLMMVDANYRPRASIILYSVIAWLGVLFLATIFSVSPYKSFWSGFERMEGFWGYWHYFIYFLVLISVFKKERDWVTFFGVSLATSLVVSFYAVAQIFGLADIHQGDDRIDATMGNATYLAIYIVFHIFLLAWLFFKSEGKSIFLRMGLLALILFETFIVYKTATRGAILGLIAGLFIGTIVNAIYSRGLTRKLALGGLGAIIFLVIGFITVKDTSFVKSSDVLTRFASISFSETTTQSRFIIWNMAYQAWQEKPILGWGPENFVYIFSKYYKSELWRQEPWFDRAHNVFLDWLTATGLVGLLSYLGMFASAVLVLWKLFRLNKITPKIATVFLGMLVAYFIHNIFVFDNFTSYMVFFAVLAYLHWLYVRTSADLSDSKLLEAMIVPKIARYVITLTIGVVVVFSLYWFNAKPILAAKSIIDSLQLVTYSQDGSRIRDLDAGVDMLKKGLAYNTFGTQEIREQLTLYSEKINQDPVTSAEDKEKITELALEQMKIQAENFPYDVRALAFLSTLYGTSGDHANSILTAKKGLEVSSSRQQFYFLLAEAYFKAGEENLALDTLKTVYELSPDYPDAINNYAVIAIFAGKPELAESLLKKHFGSEIIADTKYLNAYAAIGDFKKLTLVWEKLVLSNPTSVQYRLGLASAYVKTFQDKKAIEQLEKAIEISPSFKNQGEAFIKQIKSGKLER